MLLILRADGGPSIGAGHVMRAVALADAWKQAGGEALLVAHQTPAFFRDVVKPDRLPVEIITATPGTSADAGITAKLARERDAAWVALDGYSFDADYQDRLRAAGIRVLAIDDEGRFDRYPADVVLNQNLHAAPSMYPSTAPDTQLLLGPNYALLRREFWPWIMRRQPPRAVARRMLLTLGGSDTEDLLPCLLHGLAPLLHEGFRFDVLGPLTERRREALLARVAPLTGQLSFRASVDDMSSLLSLSDLALSSAGSTCWELAFMGVPAVLLSLAENQRAIGDSLDRAGVSVYLGRHEDVKPGQVLSAIRMLADALPARRRLSAKGRQLVDGEGGHRVVRFLRESGLPWG